MAIRREAVQISVDSNLAAVATRDAAAVALLVRELDRANNHPFFQANANGQLRATNQNATQASQGIDRVNRSATQADRSINQLTGRLSLLADGLLVLGPGLIPIAAVGAQALGGLTAAAAAAALAGGAAVAAFQGVGDAVKAVDAYQLEPTVANFEKMQAAMKAIGPDARGFVRAFQDFQPVLTEIRDSAAAGLFPGLTASLDDFARLGPRVGNLLHDIGAELGSIIGDSAESLASNRWGGFLKFLRTDMPDALRSVSTIMGDLAHGAAMMFQAFDPGNDSFLSWLEDVADGFDKWASSSEGRDDIASFLEYAKENGPAVADLFSSLVGALTAIVKAAAPLGGTVLQGLTAVAKIVETIAESDLATPLLAAVAALRIYSRVAAIATVAQSRFNTSARLGAATGQSAANRATLNANGLTGTALGAALVAPRARDVAAQQRAQRAMYAQGAAGLVAFGLVASGTAEKVNLTNTAMLTLVGTMLGPLGTAAGAAIGFTLDLTKANDDLQASIDNTNMGSTRDPIETLLERRKALVEEFGAVTNDGGFSGNMTRISAWLGGDEGEVVDAIKYIDDLIAVRRELDSLKPVSPQAGLNDLFGDLNGELIVTNSLLEDFTGALARANGFLTKRGAIVAFEQALDEVNGALKENGKTLDENTPKGRANIKVLDGIASSGLQLAQNLRGANKEKFLTRLEGDVRQAARAFGLSGKPLDNFLTKLGLIDRKKVKPKADLDDKELDRKTKKALRDLQKLAAEKPSPFADLYTAPFDQALGGAKADLRAFDGMSATATITTYYRTAGAAGRGPLRNDGFADGGFTGRGGKYEPAGIVHRGEVVLPQEVVKRDWSMLLSRYGNLPGFANGGVVGGPWGSSAASGTDWGLTVDALSDFAHGMGEASDAVKSWGGSLKESKRALEKEQRQRQNMLAFKGEVSGSLSGELTGNGLAGLDAGLSANKNDARAALAALKKAKAKGLDGPLFDLIAASGDLSLIEQFAALSRSEIRQRERQYGATRAAENALGGYATTERFGESLAANKRDIERLEKAVERGTRRGSREGSARAGREGNRRVSAGSRAGR